jgi:hypothetical protein
MPIILVWKDADLHTYTIIQGARRELNSQDPQLPLPRITTP